MAAAAAVHNTHTGSTAHGDTQTIPIQRSNWAASAWKVSRVDGCKTEGPARSLQWTFPSIPHADAHVLRQLLLVSGASKATVRIEKHADGQSVCMVVAKFPSIADIPAIMAAVLHPLKGSCSNDFDAEAFEGNIRALQAADDLLAGISGIHMTWYQNNLSPTLPYPEVVRGEGLERVSADGFVALQVRSCIAKHLLEMADTQADAARNSNAPAADASASAAGSSDGCATAAANTASISPAVPPWGTTEEARLKRLLATACFQGRIVWGPDEVYHDSPILDMLRSNPGQLLRLSAPHLQQMFHVLRAAYKRAHTAMRKSTYDHSARFNDEFSALRLLAEQPLLLTCFIPGQLHQQLLDVRDACGFDDEQLWEAVVGTPQLLLVDPADIAERVAWLNSPATCAFSDEFTGDTLAANANLLEQPLGTLTCQELAAAVGKQRCNLHCGLAACGTQEEWKQMWYMDHDQIAREEDILRALLWSTPLEEDGES